MALQVINVGLSPNDGQGDAIRTAYIKCNDNFAELYSRVQEAPPSTSAGTTGDTAGMIAFDTNYLYVCVADYDTSTEIWRRVAFDTTPW
jgi:hypothetical protein